MFDITINTALAIAIALICFMKDWVSIGDFFTIFYGFYAVIQGMRDLMPELLLRLHNTKSEAEKLFVSTYKPRLFNGFVMLLLGLGILFASYWFFLLALPFIFLYFRYGLLARKQNLPTN